MNDQPPFSVQTAAEIRETRIQTTIRVELGLLVDQGLLYMGLDSVTGESVYWATPLGEKVLCMHPDPEETVSSA